MSFWRRRRRGVETLRIGAGKPYLAPAVGYSGQLVTYAGLDLTRDEDLLIAADSLLSLLRHRRGWCLSDQDRRDLDELLPKLRTRTDAIIRARR